MTAIHTETYGQGKPIVMIHGWGMHAGIWRPFAKTLAERYRVTCVDLPGHGRSAALARFDLDSIAAALLDAVEEARPCWLGWSLGATVALDIASRFPERASGLIMLAGNPHFTRSRDAADDPAHWPGVSPRVLDAFAEQLSADAQQTLLRFLGLQVHGLSDAKSVLKTLKAAIFECGPPDPTTLRQGLAILKEADLRPALSELKCPVSAILGAHDTLVPHAVGAHLQGLNANLQVHQLARAGHVPFLSHAENLLALIDDFMETQ